ncbi:hypothetical protein R1sor_002586 [Riccia sorocarpa]|uniref:GDSL esterase/lipase n=1 Tax=Riccia sorocarpa TaxID=122646 RepID=A0ABD3H363_9MARC
MAHIVIAAFVFVLLVHSTQAQEGNNSRAYFVLGDSLVDPGNNNYIFTLARANWLPNGIDFPQGATGRFCNGRTVVDVLSELLNIPYIPPYLDPNTRGASILGGVNFASAAAGILDETGADYLDRITLNQQLVQYRNIQQQFIQQLGADAATQVFNKAIYFFIIGGNDYINNYLQLNSVSRNQYTPEEFGYHIADQFARQLSELYDMGARKIFVSNVGPLGCTPDQLAMHFSISGNCIAEVNDYVRIFNGHLKRKLNNLTVELPGSIFLYANAYDLVYDRAVNPPPYGLTVVNTGCCGAGLYNGMTPCFSSFTPCENRNQYLFWDAFHPTDAVNVQLANAYFYGDRSIISPMNVQQLAAID